MADILDQNNSTGDVDADLDLYGETDTLDPQFTEQDVLGNDDDDDDDDDHRNQHHHDKGLLTTHENGSNGEDAMAIKSDQLDHDDEQQHEHEEDEDESDLYDAAIEPSSDAASSKSNEMLGNSAGTLTASSSSLDRGGRRFCCYVGNMTWWTTDADLQDAIYASGIGDLIDIKFYENRNNGQSKGFALAVFSSESAVRQCIDKLPQKQLHGQPLVVLPYTKSSLAKFEEATRRPGQDKKPDATGVGGVGVKKDGDKAVVNFGTIRIGQAPIALRAAQQQTLGRQPPSITSLVLSAGQQPQRVQPVPLQSLAPPRPLSLIANVVQQQQQQQQQQLQPPPGAGIPQSMMMMNRPPPVYSMQPLMHQPMLQRHVLPPPQQQHAAPPGFPPPGAHINPQVS
jgi:cleavage and polyadenylation specificity factor subunit 6/7